MPRLDYFAPGVYVEEINRGSRPIEGVGTNVAGFVGFTEKLEQGAEFLKPQLVTNWNEYQKYFGGFTQFNAYLPFAVYGFFLNGGGRCWISSIGTDPRGHQIQRQFDLIINNRSGNRNSLGFNLLSNQNHEPVIIEIKNSDPRQTSGDGQPNPQEFFSLTIQRHNQIINTYEHLSMDQNVQSELGDYIITALAQNEVIQVQDLNNVGRPLARRPANGSYELKPPLPSLQADNFSQELEGERDERTGIKGIFEIDEINIFACPDIMWAYEHGLINMDQVIGLMETMISMCEGSLTGETPNAPNRMIVIDTPHDKVKPQEVKEWIDSVFTRRSMFVALYYPWVKVPNLANKGNPIFVPPCGHIMGVWARTDETRGVYKAPANEVPRGVTGLAYYTNFREQELLNPIGINCLRSFPNQGIRIWGARTLVEPDRTEWRYINVRRLISYIEKSIELGTQWVVFEPNDPDLWARVTRTVRNFLQRLWREGALFGATPEQAFYIKCDEEINTPETIMLGRLYIEVGICPVRPAEFVIFRISQWNPGEEA